MDTSTWSPLYEHAPPSVAKLEDWCTSHNIVRHAGISIQETEARGMGVVSSQSVAQGGILCTIPKSAIFSHRSASFSTIIPPPEEPTSTTAILYLTACLLHELRLGRESSWYPWLQVLPREPVLLPIFWEDSELAGEDGQQALGLLKGTQARRELDRQESEGLTLAELKAFYSDLAPHLPSTSECPNPSPLKSFLYAYSMVSTRTFVIDSYITIGMIPFCDMFNHASIAHLALATDPWVCTTCGSLFQCQHDNVASEAGPERLEHLSADYLEKLRMDGGDKTIEMRVVRSIEAGEEVTFCYEEGISDAKSLVGWGFVTAERGGNGILWSTREILDQRTIRAFFGLVQTKALVGLVEDGNKVVSGEKDDVEGVMGFTADGRIGLRLLAALMLEHLSNIEPEDMEKVIETLKTVIADLSTFDKMNETSMSRSPISSSTAQSIVKMIQARQLRLAHQELSLDDLRAIRKDLAGKAALRAMALDLLISERELLDSVNVRWKRILSVSPADFT